MTKLKNILHKFQSFSKLKRGVIITSVAFLIGFNSYFALLYISLNTYKPLSPEEVEEKIEEYTNDTKESQVQGAATQNLNHDTPYVLLIPKLGLDLGIYEGGLEGLEKGIWHRFPERGNPEMGGNFILSGHRFNIGFSPDGIRKASPLYNIDELEIGDELIVIWEKKEYKYKVTKLYKVKPEDVDIEDPSSDAKLTLYTCTLNGSSDGRVVVEAKI